MSLSAFGFDMIRLSFRYEFCPSIMDMNHWTHRDVCYRTYKNRVHSCRKNLKLVIKHACLHIPSLLIGPWGWRIVFTVLPGRRLSNQTELCKYSEIPHIWMQCECEITRGMSEMVRGHFSLPFVEFSYNMESRMVYLEAASKTPHSLFWFMSLSLFLYQNR